MVAGFAALLLLGWGGCAAYGAAQRRFALQDARIQAAVARGDSVIAANQAQHDSIQALTAGQADRDKRIAELEQQASTARKAQAEAQAIAARLRRQLGAPQTARDSGYVAVIGALDDALARAAEAARADTMRIVALTHDRDGWKVAALHADSLLQASSRAIKGLQGVAKPERCLLGLIVCPSRNLIAGIGVVTTVLGYVVGKHS